MGGDGEHIEATRPTRSSSNGNKREKTYQDRESRGRRTLDGQTLGPNKLSPSSSEGGHSQKNWRLREIEGREKKYWEKRGRSDSEINFDTVRSRTNTASM